MASYKKRKGHEQENEPQGDPLDVFNYGMDKIPDLSEFPFDRRPKITEVFYLLLTKFTRIGASSLRDRKTGYNSEDSFFDMIFDFVNSAIQQPQGEPMLVAKEDLPCLLNGGYECFPIADKKHPQKATHMFYRGPYFTLDGETYLPRYTIVVETLLSETGMPQDATSAAVDIATGRTRPQERRRGSEAEEPFDEQRAYDVLMAHNRPMTSDHLLTFNKATSTPLTEVFCDGNIRGYLVSVLIHDPAFSMEQAFHLQASSNCLFYSQVVKEHHEIQKKINEALYREAKNSGSSEGALSTASATQDPRLTIARINHTGRIINSLRWHAEINHYRKLISTDPAKPNSKPILLDKAHPIYNESHEFDANSPNAQSTYPESLRVNETSQYFSYCLFANGEELQEVLKLRGVCALQCAKRAFQDRHGGFFFAAPIPCATYKVRIEDLPIIKDLRFPQVIALRYALKEERDPNLACLKRIRGLTSMQLCELRFPTRVEMPSGISERHYQPQEGLGVRFEGQHNLVFATPATPQTIDRRGDQLRDLRVITTEAYKMECEDRNRTSLAVGAINDYILKRQEPGEPPVSIRMPYFRDQDCVGQVLWNINHHMVMLSDLAYNHVHLINSFIVALTPMSCTIRNNRGSSLPAAFLSGGPGIGKSKILETISNFMLVPGTFYYVTYQSRRSYFYQGQGRDLGLALRNELTAQDVGMGNDDERIMVEKEIRADGHISSSILTKRADGSFGLQTEDKVLRMPTLSAANIHLTGSDQKSNAGSDRWIVMPVIANMLRTNEATSGIFNTESNQQVIQHNMRGMSTYFRDLHALTSLALIKMELGNITRPDTSLLELLFARMRTNPVRFPDGLQTRKPGQMTKLYTVLVVLGAVHMTFYSPLSPFFLHEPRGDGTYSVRSQPFHEDMIYHIVPWLQPSLHAGIYVISQFYFTDFTAVHTILRKLMRKMGIDFDLIAEWVQWTDQCQLISNLIKASTPGRSNLRAPLPPSRADPGIHGFTASFPERLEEDPSIDRPRFTFMHGKSGSSMLPPMDPECRKLARYRKEKGELEAKRKREGELEEAEAKKLSNLHHLISQQEDKNVRIWEEYFPISTLPRAAFEQGTHVPKMPAKNHLTYTAVRKIKFHEYSAKRNAQGDDRPPCLPFAIIRENGESYFDLNYFEIYQSDHPGNWINGLTSVIKEALGAGDKEKIIHMEAYKEIMKTRKFECADLGRCTQATVPKTLQEFSRYLQATKLADAKKLITIPIVCYGDPIKPADLTGEEPFSHPQGEGRRGGGSSSGGENRRNPGERESRQANSHSDGPQADSFKTVKISTLFLFHTTEALQDYLTEPLFDKNATRCYNAPLAFPNSEAVPIFQTYRQGPGTGAVKINTQNQFDNTNVKFFMRQKVDRARAEQSFCFETRHSQTGQEVNRDNMSDADYYTKIYLQEHGLDMDYLLPSQIGNYVQEMKDSGLDIDITDVSVIRRQIDKNRVVATA